MGEFFQQLIAVDWGGLIGAAVASGVGLSFVTQLLKNKRIKVPAKKYPRTVSAVLSVLVGIISTVAIGLELSSLASFVVFAVVAFVTSGIAYDVVKRLVQEVKQEEPVTHLGAVEVSVQTPARIETPAAVSLEDIAQQVIAGEWGAGTERKDRLEAAGFAYEEVQKTVKELVARK